jgi:hypothetical protein
VPETTKVEIAPGPEGIDQMIDRVNHLRARLYSSALPAEERPKVAERLATWRARLATLLAQTGSKS